MGCFMLQSWAIATLLAVSVGTTERSISGDSLRSVLDTYKVCFVRSALKVAYYSPNIPSGWTLNKDDMIELADYWCSIVDSTFLCTKQQAEDCSYPDLVRAVIEDSHGICSGNQMKQVFKETIPEDFAYNLSCNHEAEVEVKKCYQLPNDVTDDVDVLNAWDLLGPRTHEYLECVPRTIENSDSACVRSPSSVWLINIRALIFRIPYSVGINMTSPFVKQIMEFN